MVFRLFYLALYVFVGKSTRSYAFSYNIESDVKRCCVKTFLVPLTPEEEADCLKRWQSGERAAKEELILHNMRLVAHVAKKYIRNGGLSFQDLAVDLPMEPACFSGENVYHDFEK